MEKLFKVKARPSAKKETLKKISPDKYEIAVQEPAEKGMANKRILEIIKTKISPGAKRIIMVSGHKTKSKVIKTVF